jgi:hypothetical protein
MKANAPAFLRWQREKADTASAKSRQAQAIADYGKPLRDSRHIDLGSRLLAIGFFCFKRTGGAMNVEVGIWISSVVLAILGLLQAVHSAQPILWLAIWPAPITLLCTIFIFLSQGFHFRNGVLVLGRRTPDKRSHAKQTSSSVSHAHTMADRSPHRPS